MGDPLKVLEDGVATGLHGNPGHPFTRGALCVKVNRWLEHAAAQVADLHIRSVHLGESPLEVHRAIVAATPRDVPGPSRAP